jgi:hypothetical protein
MKMVSLLGGPPIVLEELPEARCSAVAMIFQEFDRITDPEDLRLLLKLVVILTYRPPRREKAHQ